MRPEINDRDMMLRIKGHLYELEAVNDEVIGGQQGWPMAKQGYESTLLNVAECGDTESVDEVAAYIKEYVEDREERPANRKVRRNARRIVSERGYAPTRYLNTA